MNAKQMVQLVSERELSERTDVNSDLHSTVMPLHREKKQTFSDLSSTENN